MQDELAEIRDFLATCPPFDTLDNAGLDDLPRHFVIRYLRRGTAFPPVDEPCLWVVRQGAIELRTGDGQLARRLGEGDIHDAPCLPESEESRWAGHAVEDTLLYVLPKAELEALWRDHPDLRAQALAGLGERLRRVAKDPLGGAPAEGDLTGLPLSALIGRPPVQAAQDMPIREAAALMTRERVSALLILGGERLVGILTDRDLRSRCLAAGLADDTPVSAVMTSEPFGMTPDASAFEAVLEMTHRGIHHLPVLEAGRVRGLVSNTDLLRAQGISAIHLADRIHRAADLGELVRDADRVRELWLGLASRGVPASALGKMLSAIADALTSRLLALAEARLGPPPVAYAWIAYGSLGRRELNLHSDQDNALVLADDYQEALHGAYFGKLADAVCDGLAACGMVPCPGGMMASNPQWRRPLAEWLALFTRWIFHTDTQTARLASNFFDFRVVGGEASLCQPLGKLICRESPLHQTLFLHLAGNALGHPIPLGFFRQFVLGRGGGQNGHLDIKLQGLLPIADLARIYSLARGGAETGTAARLRAAAGGPLLGRAGADNLLAAFDFLQALRVRHQCERLLSGLPPDNLIEPRRLSALERQLLRDTFSVVADQIKALRLAFPEVRGG